MANSDPAPSGHAQPRLAVLIDGDNAEPGQARLIMEEVARHGRPTVRRIYGNWTGPHLAGWKEKLLEHAIQPIQQFSYVTGKNATDVAMVIDAMDLLHANTVEAFCLVTSDSDYTRLAARLRESGKLVIVMGRSKTPSPLQKAGDRFVDLGLLEKETTKARPPARSRAKAPTDRPSSQEGTRSETELVALLRRAVDLASDEDGWSPFSRVVETLRQLDQAFDPRQHGRNQPIKLFRERTDDFEFDETGGRTVRIRNIED